MNIFEGTHIRLDLKRYPRIVFFFKEDVFWMCYDWEVGYLWCRRKGFWEVLDRENNREVQAIIKDQVEKHFKLKNITPSCAGCKPISGAEKHFKLKGITPKISIGWNTIGVEQHLKLKGIRSSKTWRNEQIPIKYHFREHF